VNLFFRLFWLSLVSRFRKPCSVLGPCETPFRCSLFDLDILRHMNNGKYLSILDLARVDLMNRAGLSQELRARGFYPVVVAETIRFRKSIRAFESFTVVTKVIGWDEKAFIVEQSFMKKGVLIADAVIRARFLKVSGGAVLPKDILAMSGVHETSPALPDWVQRWNEIHSS
jgi:acyl-CoA thioesterase FadM